MTRLSGTAGTVLLVGVALAGCTSGSDTSGAAGAAGGAGTSGSAGATGSAGTAGSAGATGGAGAGGGASTTGGAGGRGGSAGATGVAGAGGGAGATGGAPAPCGPCGTHRWACWPMPNPATSGLPNPASYKDNGDGTITDNVTCLTWQKTAGPSTYSVDEGRAYCASLGAGWRMGTRMEMMSIDDFTLAGAKIAAPFTAKSGFFKTGSEWVLTTKQIGAGAGKDLGWAFNFSDGIVSNAQSGAVKDSVRCVRGGGDDPFDTAPGALAVAPPGQYTIVAAGEVRDNYTGLVWQQGDSAQTAPMATMVWADAKIYCAGLTLGGHSWRLPSIRELSTLVDEAQVGPAINRTVFPMTKYGSKSNNWYWASHQAAGMTAAWAINFDDGFTGFNAGSDSTKWNYFTAAWTRCVR